MEDLLASGSSTISLLLLFIIGLLTRRFVPWWVYEDALKKLEEYEREGPKLLEELRTLLDEKNAGNLDD